MTDTRGIGRRVSFEGDEGKYGEWKAKLLAYLRVAVPNSDSWIQRCGQQQIAILESDIDVEFGNDAFTVKEFAAKFYSMLLSCTEDERFPDLPQRQGRGRVGSHEVVDETVRAEDSWHEEGCVEGDDQQRSAKKPEDIEKNLMNVEELMKKYEVLGGESLPEDLRVTVIIDLRTKKYQGALGVDHPRDEVQRGPRRGHELRGKEK